MTGVVRMHLFPCALKGVQYNNDIAFHFRVSYNVNLDICCMMLIKPGARDISSISDYEPAHFKSQTQLLTTCTFYDTKERQLQRVITMTYVCRNPKGGWNEGKFHPASGILKIYRTTKPENHWQQNLCSLLFARSPIDACRPNL